MDQVIEIAQKLGLHCRGDSQDGQVRARLLVSKSPLSWEFANSLAIGQGKDSDWIGTVAVIRGHEGVFPVPHDMRVWGKFFLYGDQSVIEELTGETKP
jgi:hypothetical protein